MGALPSLKEVHDNFNYDPLSGQLFWKKSGHGRRKNKCVGSINNDGYLQVVFNYKLIPVHRLVWFLHHGVWPSFIDHKDRDRLNNRLENLREVTPFENTMNSSIVNALSPKVKWVHRFKNKYQVRRSEQGKSRYYGTFDSLEQASEVANSLNVETP